MLQLLVILPWWVGVITGNLDSLLFALWRITRAGGPGARMYMRTGGTRSPKSGCHGLLPPGTRPVAGRRLLLLLLLCYYRAFFRHTQIYIVFIPSLCFLWAGESRTGEQGMGRGKAGNRKRRKRDQQHLIDLPTIPRTYLVSRLPTSSSLLFCFTEMLFIFFIRFPPPTTTVQSNPYTA